MKYKLSKYLHLLSRELTFNSCYYTCVFSCRSGMLFMIKSNDWQKIQDADLSGRSALHDNFKNLLKGNYTECSNCAIFPLCMGGCPKSLLEKKYPCPSYKYNLDDRILLYCLYSNMDKKDFIENINLAIP